MSEPAQNEFAMAIDQIRSRDVEDNIYGDEDSQNQLSEALTDLFASAMEGFEVPEDDEERADAMLREIILALMDISFKAGMLYHSYFVTDEQQDIGTLSPIPISPETATQMVFGLMGDGISLKLVVDRGPH